MRSRGKIDLQKVNHPFRAGSSKNYLEFLARVCRSTTSTWGSVALGHLRARNYLALIELADSLSGQKYPDAAEHFAANQFSHLIKKYPWPSDHVKLDPEAQAKKKFWASEHYCKRVNQRFLCFNRRSPDEAPLQRMRDFVSYVLGTEPRFSRIWSLCEFGPGASMGVHGDATSAARKIASSWTMTPGIVHYAIAAVRSHSQLFEFFSESKGAFFAVDPILVAKNFQDGARIVTHNKITFVPKTARVHRTIAIEPLANGFVQKGIDAYMRFCLRRVNIDLRDQSRNQEFARLGSLDDSAEGFVTIDLSSASDSIAREVVRNILPPSWYEFLDSCRSKNFELDGVIHPFQKFCSMGNGFCFPLETLLFAAACHACGCGRPGVDFTVYGDDIIVRKKHSAELLRLLGVLGFRVNPDKTFLEGPFRESCGADWYRGVDVRPFTLDFRLDSLQNVFKALNSTARKPHLELFFTGSREFLFSLVPADLRFVRPYPGNDDTAITVEFDTFLTSSYARWETTLQCWSWKELSPSAVHDSSWQRHEKSSVLLLYSALRGGSSDQPYTYRRKTVTKVRRMAYSGAWSTWLPPLG